MTHATPTATLPDWKESSRGSVPMPEKILFPILDSVPTRENVQFVGDGSSHSDGHLAFVHIHCELANTTSWQSVILSKSSPHFWPGGKMYKRSQMKERTNSMYPPQKSKNISNNDPASDKVSRWDCPGATAVRWPTVRLGLMPTCPLSLSTCKKTFVDLEGEAGSGRRVRFWGCHKSPTWYVMVHFTTNKHKFLL